MSKEILVKVEDFLNEMVGDHLISGTSKEALMQNLNESLVSKKKSLFSREITKVLEIEDDEVLRSFMQENFFSWEESWISWAELCDKYIAWRDQNLTRLENEEWSDSFIQQIQQRLQEIEGYKEFVPENFDEESWNQQLRTIVQKKRLQLLNQALIVLSFFVKFKSNESEANNDDFDIWDLWDDEYHKAIQNSIHSTAIYDSIQEDKRANLDELKNNYKQFHDEKMSDYHSYLVSIQEQLKSSTELAKLRREKVEEIYNSIPDSIQDNQELQDLKLDTSIKLKNITSVEQQLLFEKRYIESLLKISLKLDSMINDVSIPLDLYKRYKKTPESMKSLHLLDDLKNRAMKISALLEKHEKEITNFLWKEYTSTNYSSVLVKELNILKNTIASWQTELKWLIKACDDDIAELWKRGDVKIQLNNYIQKCHATKYNTSNNYNDGSNIYSLLCNVDALIQEWKALLPMASRYGKKNEEKKISNHLLLLSALKKETWFVNYAKLLQQKFTTLEGKDFSKYPDNDSFKWKKVFKEILVNQQNTYKQVLILQWIESMGLKLPIESDTFTYIYFNWRVYISTIHDTYIADLPLKDLASHARHLNTIQLQNHTWEVLSYEEAWWKSIDLKSLESLEQKAWGEDRFVEFQRSFHDEMSVLRRLISVDTIDAETICEMLAREIEWDDMKKTIDTKLAERKKDKVEISYQDFFALCIKFWYEVDFVDDSLIVSFVKFYHYKSFSYHNSEDSTEDTKIKKWKIISMIDAMRLYGYTNLKIYDSIIAVLYSSSISYNFMKWFIQRYLHHLDWWSLPMDNR